MLFKLWLTKSGVGGNRGLPALRRSQRPSTDTYIYGAGIKLLKYFRKEEIFHHQYKKKNIANFSLNLLLFIQESVFNLPLSNK